MRVVKVMGNQPVKATVGGKKCYFRSKLEYKWARYLEFLKAGGAIRDWDFEPSDVEPFYFPGEKTAPVQYRPDFRVIDKDGNEFWQETKGWHDGKTNEKFRRMQKHHPDVVMELVLQSIPKRKGINRRETAKKYVRRIIDASVIFRQVKKAININVPIVGEL